MLQCSNKRGYVVQLSEDEWKKKLTPEQYRVMRQKGTEVPFSGDYVKPAVDGTFTCAACGNELFKGNKQYESNMPGLSGWPSFSEVAKSDAVKLQADNDMGMQRTEVVCAKCGSHLGHLFEGDDSAPNGKHFCINSVCLNFEPEVPKK